MSFVYGGVSVESLGDVCATPTFYPTQGGLTVDTLSTPGRDGRFYGGTRRSAVPFEYEVTITGDTQEEAAEVRDDLMSVIDPARGPQSFIMDDMTDWMYPRVTVSADIEWVKHGWGAPDRKTIYQATISFETTDDSTAREIEPTDLSSPSSYTHDLGTTSAYPTIVVTPISDADDLTIQVGQHSVTVERFNSWTGNDELVMDYDRMRFYLANGNGERTASAVGHMSNYERPVLHQGDVYQISVSPERPYRFLPNARRA